MSDRIRAHLRSNIVGYIALFCFAMSGTAVALDGSNTVFTDDIVNGQVTGPDLGDDSVNGNKLKNDSTASRHVVNNSLKSEDVLDNNLTGADVANTDSLGPAEIGELGDSELGPGSVGRDEIADGTFFAGDIADACCGDFEIPDDAIQSNEIADDAVGGAELSVLTRLGPDTTIPDDGGAGLTILEAECDMGEKALGGGASNFGATGVYMTQSVPLPDTGGGEVPTGWRVTVENQSGAEQSGSAWAICTQVGVTAESARGRN